MRFLTMSRSSRAHVVWALGELLGKKALPILNKILTNEEEDIVKDRDKILYNGIIANVKIK